MVLKGITILSLLFTIPCQAQLYDLIQSSIQKRVNASMMVMGYSLTPDVTTGSLSITDSKNGNPDLAMTSLGGGGTLSENFPLYVEGTLALNRYDPSFVATNGNDIQILHTKWNSIAGTGGIGWDFKLTDQLKFRPMVNVSLGHLESDLSLAERYIQYKTGLDFDFLKQGRLNTYGIGGSAVLDYEDYRPEEEIDVELRYTDIELNSFDSSEAVDGHVSSQSVSLWARRRVPLNFTLFGKPVRNVLEVAHTQYIGDLRGAMGFDYLSSIGAGLEYEIKDYDIFFSRARMMLRYQFGDNVHGWSVGLAASF